MASDDTTTQVRLTNSPIASTLHPRHEQAFPTLSPTEIERIRRFGEIRHYAHGEKLFETGKPGPGMFVVLKGVVSVTQRDGMGHVTPVVEQGQGQFLAEIGQLSGRNALVDGTAEGDVDALLVPPESLRRLLIAEAELGERIMRALILRRVALIEGGIGGPVVIGPPSLASLARIENFLRRNGVPYHLLDPATDKDAADLVARYSPSLADLPLVVAFDGKVLRNPSETELAYAIGMIGHSHNKLYDVAIVGGGPAGLATAVYAASEGLEVAVLDARAFGGQAGASARIENYLGFPTGISGQALAGRAFTQAQKFGADMLIPIEAMSLDCSKKDGAFAVATMCGQKVNAKSIVVASGARYRRPDIKNLADFEGRGIWYWASPIEARLCAQQEVILVGGGNSAGQAAVFLSSHAAKVKMMVRSDGLAASMSRYLIDRLEATPNIELMFNTEIVALEGSPDEGLSRARWRNRKTNEEASGDIRNVFLFVGADPATSWLANCGVELDRTGFVVTGKTTDASPAVAQLQTTVPGVFAVGDVRAGSVKRVGGAIGEGAQVVAALHGYLADNAVPHA